MMKIPIMLRQFISEFSLLHYVTTIIPVLPHNRTGRYVMERVFKPWLYFDTIYNITGKGKRASRHLKKLHTFTKTVSITDMELPQIIS